MNEKEEDGSLQLDQDPSKPLAQTGYPPVTRIVVVIPTYNERETLPLLVRAILALGPPFGVIVVDDRSPDGTGRVAESLAREYPGRIDVIHRSSKSGIAGAYIAGMRLALELGAQAVALMDADLSHDPECLPMMVGLLPTCDLVLGSRYIRGGSTIGWPRWRQLLSRAGGHYARLVLRSPVQDVTSGFRVMSAEALRSLPLDEIAASGFAFNLELTHRLIRSGCTARETPIAFRERAAGASKLTLGIVVEGLVVVWKLRRIRQTNLVISRKM